jgi:hypothetical protein
VKKAIRRGSYVAMSHLFTPYFSASVQDHLRLFFQWLLWRIPANVDYFVKLFQILNGHRHIIISRDNLQLVSFLV